MAKLTGKMIAAMDKQEFLTFVKESIVPKKTNRRGLHVVFPYTLTASMDTKVYDASNKEKWTAFVNNAGNLAHVICPEANLLLRIKLTYTVKHLSMRRIHEIIIARTERWINI